MITLDGLQSALAELPEPEDLAAADARSASIGENAGDKTAGAENLGDENPGDPLAGKLRSLRKSAVLVPLYEANGELHLILTRRAAHLRAHSREVSFPGGGQDETDRSFWDTALREAREEISLESELVNFMGHLPQFRTVGSRSLIHPQVGFIQNGKPKGLTPDPNEVERILHVPLRELLMDEVFREEVWNIPMIGQAAVNFFELVGDTVWGATAAMLRQLLALGTKTETLAESRHFWEQDRS